MIRYVGLSSSGMRRPKSHRKIRADTYCSCWVQSLIRTGFEYEIVVLEEFNSTDPLPQAERWWIAYGRASGWPLTNLTDGGEGLLNPSARTRLKISEAMRERMSTPESRQRSREIALKLFSSDEARQAISIRNRAFMLRPDVRATNSERSRAYWAAEDARAAQRERSRSAYKDPALRARIGSYSQARMSTPEAKERQSRLTKARLATPEARALHGERIRQGMTTPEARAKRLSGDSNPARRPEVRAKMRESSRKRWKRQRDSKIQTK